MADMLVDSVKLDACLDAEADAIRAKTGGSADIPFDFANNKGFADAIAAIPSRGGTQTISFLDWEQSSCNTSGGFQPSTTRIVSKHALYRCQSIAIPEGVEIAFGAANNPEIENGISLLTSFAGFWNGTNYASGFTWFSSSTIDLTDFLNWSDYYFIMLLRYPDNSEIAPSVGNSVVVSYDLSDGAVINFGRG